MRMLCMFDLPVETDEERRSYRIFRKNLIQEGFVMMQYSVYVRVCPSREYANRLEKRIKKFIPREGNVKIGTEIHCDDKHLTDDYLGCNVECYVEIPKETR